MQLPDISSALSLPKNHNFRPFIKTFQIFKQLTPNLLHMNNYEFPTIKKICKIVEKLDSVAINLASFSDYRLSLTISSSLFLINQIYDHIHNFSQKTKNKLLLWDSSTLNLYNELSLIWLSLNLPYNYQPIISKDIFKGEIKSKFTKLDEVYLNEICENFHEVASAHWLKLQNPNMNDLKNIILEIVAHVKVNEIAKKQKLEQMNLVSKTLYEVIYFLIYEKNELVSENGFLNIFKIKLGQKYYECNLNETCDDQFKDYYNFCKRFVLYDFPISNVKNNVIKAFFIYLRDCITKIKVLIMRFYDQNVRKTLHKVEMHLDTIYFASYNKFRALSQEALPMSYNELEEENYENRGKVDLFYNVIEKTDNISDLIKDFSFFTIQSNRFVQTADSFFGVTNKLIASEIITDWFFEKIYQIIWNNPVVKYATEQTEKSIVIFFEKKKEFTFRNINFHMIKNLIKFMKNFTFCVIYENPKFFIVKINRICLINIPEFMKRAFLFLQGLRMILEISLKKMVKIREIKSDSVALYRKTVEKIKEEKNRLNLSLLEFKEKIKERKKKEFPLLV